MYDNPASSLINMIMGAGLLYILLILASAFLNYYIFYRVVRASVRDGIADAVKRNGGNLGGGGGAYVQGYPPEQEYGAPAAPTYRGPNG